MWVPNESCLRLLTQEIAWALPFAFASAGKSIAARMAMMAMTTSSSIRVNPDLPEGRKRAADIFMAFVVLDRNANDSVSERRFKQDLIETISLLQGFSIPCLRGATG